jgi:hypothetical protein
VTVGGCVSSGAGRLSASWGWCCPLENPAVDLQCMWSSLELTLCSLVGV